MTPSTKIDLSAFDKLRDDATMRVFRIPGGAPPAKKGFAQGVLEALLAEWNSDDKIANGAVAFIAQDRFLLIGYELTGGDLSGCTKDQLTHTIQAIEQQFDREMLTAPRLAVEASDGGVEFLSQRQFRERREASEIGEATVVYDHLVETVGAARGGFRTTVGESWYARVGG